MSHKLFKLGMVGDRKIDWGSHPRTRTAILSKRTFRAGTFNVIYETRIYADFSTRVYGSLDVPAFEFTKICGPFKNAYIRDLHGRIYRGYYTVTRRYEFYARVGRTISHE